MRYRLSTFVAFLSLTLVSQSGLAQSKDKEPGWTFAPVTGLANPNLDSLYEGIFLAPFSGQSEIVTDLPEDVEGDVSYPVQNFLIENSLPRVGIGPEAGLEFRRRFGSKNDFFIGISSWEISALSEVATVFPMQGDLDNRVTYERRGKFSYTQYYLGLRHYLFERGKRFNVFINTSIHELFDIDYTETHVFDFLSGRPAGFQRVAVYQSQSTGLLMLQFGLGLEVNIAKRFGISTEGAWSFGLNQVGLRGVNERSDFNDGDRLREPPYPIEDDPATGYTSALSQDGLSRDAVFLDLSGWRFLVKFNVAF